MIQEELIYFDIEERGSQKCCLIIGTTRGEYKHKFYNKHNGYYSHTLSVYKNNEMIMSKCL